MGTSEMALQVLSASSTRLFCSDPCLGRNNSILPIKSNLKWLNRRCSKRTQQIKCPRLLQNHIRNGVWAVGSVSNGKINRFQSLSCRCQKTESIGEIVAEDGDGAWFVDALKSNPISSEVSGPNLIDFEVAQQLKDEKEGVVSNGKVAGGRVAGDTSRKHHSIEDEAWNLLHESMVYYCGTPIGTIAAKDPTSSNTLNYDQVFIRDFIPSGIAFLLKGDYDIVRNFILHTLQLQSWEKTMDCHSPGQGLMPASFKVRTVPLDGDEFATEEVLDPDFGEAAIGRVAPVDSGLWWIILLRAYGKCSGDRSVQERIDVQTGIKMILKLCLADGFDMFPTLLVTDGSCMIDRRMGIHGHPLEIQLLNQRIQLSANSEIAVEKFPNKLSTFGL